MTTVCLTGGVLAQEVKTPQNAQQKVQFTAAEEAKLKYISKQQEMAATYHRDKFVEAEGYFAELLDMMNAYIKEETNETKKIKMKELLDKVQGLKANFKSSFNEIYSNTKLFISYL